MAYIRDWLGTNPPITKFDRIKIIHGSGSPEGVVTADPTGFYLDIDGGPGATFWVKESGINTNTGWSSTTGLPVGATEGGVLTFAAGVPAWDTANRLVPTGGTPGQLVAINASSDTALVDRDTSGNVTLPVDFSGGLQAIGNRTIPGGAMGPNGFMRQTVLAKVVTNATRTVTFTSNGTSMDTTVTNTTDSWDMKFENLVLNANSETSQYEHHSLITGRHIAAATTVVSLDHNSFIVHNNTDTTVDWVVGGNVLPSAAITGSANIVAVNIEYGYAA